MAYIKQGGPEIPAQLVDEVFKKTGFFIRHANTAHGCELVALDKAAIGSRHLLIAKIIGRNFKSGRLKVSNVV